MNNVRALFPEPTPEPSRFEEIWKLWPNKAKKPLARAKYDAILKGGYDTRTLDRDSGLFVAIELGATADDILAGVKKYLDSQLDRNTYRLKDDGKYIPHLATWLNGGRWEDFL
jgi:hypothetical protein